MIKEYQKIYSDKLGLTSFSTEISHINGMPPICEEYPKDIEHPTEDEFKEKFWENTDEEIK